MLPGEIIVKGGCEHGIVDAKRLEFYPVRKPLEGEVDLVENMFRMQTVPAEDYDKMGNLGNGFGYGTGIWAPDIPGSVPYTDSLPLKLGAEIIGDVFVR